MARPGITQAQVFEIAQALQDEGITPTVKQVRERLGNTGSYATLSRHLSAWRDANQPEPQIPPVPESVQRIARRLWAEAHRLASSELEQAQTAWAQERQQRTQELQSLALDLDHKDKAFGEAMAQLKTSMRRLTELEVALDYLKAENDRLDRERQEALERQRQLERDNAALAQKLADVASEVERLREALAATTEQERQALIELAKIKGKLEAVEQTSGPSPSRRKS